MADKNWRLCAEPGCAEAWGLLQADEFRADPQGEFCFVCYHRMAEVWLTKILDLEGRLTPAYKQRLSRLRKDRERLRRRSYHREYKRKRATA